MNAKVGSQETPGGTGKFGLGVQNEAGQRLNRVLPREHTGHSKHPLPTTQEHHQMVCTKIRLIISFAAKDGEALYSQQKTRPGVNYGSDHELLIAKFRLKMKKVGKTIRSLRYDPYQILMM